MKRFFILLIIIAATALTEAAEGAQADRAADRRHNDDRQNTAGQSPRNKATHPDERGYIYRLTLKDKQGTPFRLDRPRDFLSRKAIERRRRQHLSTDSTDLPVCPRYLRLFDTDGTRVIGTSRWLNSVLVRTGTDTTAIARLRSLSCVKECVMVWQSPDSVTEADKPASFHDRFNSWDTITTSRYGAAQEQIEMMAGQRLHEAGFDGRGMTIAVLDGGFLNAGRIPVMQDINVRGIRDFVDRPAPKARGRHTAGTADITDHGTKVLSVMGVNAPNVYIGTAPGAAYWLLRCEDRRTEQPVEEDYWVMAAEYADSVGADIINSSLGYNEFDNHLGDHAYRELDGRTAVISRAASMLAGKGIVLVCSAGNSGMGPWKKITFPADAVDVLTVGAVTPWRGNAPFNGVGPTQDGRVKPDVMAPGSPASVISGRGTVVQDMGTSFATPLVCGLVACLWQARPELTAREIIELVRRSGDNSGHPDNIFGYGIPDFGRALKDR